MDDHIRLPDGRGLDIYVSGPADRMALIFHHGTPTCRRPEQAIEAAAHARGLRYVAASRPGYGGSDRHAGRRVVDVVADTRALRDAVGGGDCVIAGHSGGGPHALACAAALEGVRATLVIAGVGPNDVADLDFVAGMGEENVIEFRAAEAGEAALRAVLEAQRPTLVTAEAPGIIETMSSLLPPIDREMLSEEMGSETIGQFREGLANGVDGWVDDSLAFVAPWGFSAAEIATPVTVWQGGADLMVPYAHGEWLARTIPGADAHLLADEGHLSIAVGKAEAMLDALLALA